MSEATKEMMGNILLWMVFLIAFLFLLDIIIHMVKNLFGLNFKKMLAGAGVGFGFMAFKDWYQKHHVSVKEYTTEKIDEE